MNVSKAVLSFMRQTSQNVKTVRNYSAAAYTTRYGDYETIQVTAPCDHVLQVELHRPDKRNAMNRDMFREITACFSEIANDKQCRAVVVSGTGKMFTSGIDFHDFFTMMTSAVSTNEADMDQRDDVASKAKYIRHIISILQNSFNMMVKCQKPVISAVHSGCIGAGVDMISGTDIRYASQDVYFSVREVVLGLAADLGTLQRLPKIVGNDSLVREMAFTGRDISAAEAKEFGLISRVYKDRDETVEAAIECAKLIATKSPVAVQGTKVNLNYSRDHSEKDGLEFMQVWNMCMLQSDDLANSFAALKGQAPEYGDF